MLNKAEKKILKKYKDAIKEFAGELSFEIEKCYEDVISKFYASYGPNNGEPWSYKRTLSTYLGSNGAEDPFSPINVQQFGNDFFAGIGISASNIPGNPYRANKEWVFNRTFYKGIHGINRRDAFKINETIRQKTRRGEWDGSGIIKVKGRFNSKDFVDHVPTNMTPPPKVEMDRAFKKLTKKKNMDRMLDEVMKKVML